MNENFEDIFYELRMLLGAGRMIELFDTKSMGNSVNYFKDSVYLHARCLYSFFYKKDKTLYEMVEYNTKWKKVINDYVMHLYDDDSRSKSANTVDGIHVNTKCLWFVSDLLRLWKLWINNESNIKLKQDLKTALDNANEEAKNDYESLKKKLQR